MTKPANIANPNSHRLCTHSAGLPEGTVVVSGFSEMEDVKFR
jgi:hypothetical protein